MVERPAAWDSVRLLALLEESCTYHIEVPVQPKWAEHYSVEGMQLVVQLQWQLPAQ